MHLQPCKGCSGPCRRCEQYGPPRYNEFHSCQMVAVLLFKNQKALCSNTFLLPTESKLINNKFVSVLDFSILHGTCLHIEAIKGITSEPDAGPPDEHNYAGQDVSNRIVF